MYLFNFLHSNQLYRTLPHFFQSSITDKLMASGTPSPQVRIPPTGLLLPPPPLCSHYTTWGNIYPAAEKLTGGVKIMLRRNIYPGRARVGPKFEKKFKNSHSAEKCRTVPKVP